MVIRTSIHCAISCTIACKNHWRDTIRNSYPLNLPFNWFPPTVAVSSWTESYVVYCGFIDQNFVYLYLHLRKTPVRNAASICLKTIQVTVLGQLPPGQLPHGQLQPRTTLISDNSNREQLPPRITPTLTTYTRTTLTKTTSTGKISPRIFSTAENAHPKNAHFFIYNWPIDHGDTNLWKKICLTH